MLDRALRALQHPPVVAISARADPAIEAFAHDRSVTTITDDPNCAMGPLAGILAGWARKRRLQTLATVPCDTPLLPLDLAPKLLSRSVGANATYAKTSRGAHPPCAVWDTSLVGPLRSTLKAERHPPVRAFLTDIGATPVWFDGADAFSHAHTPKILSELEQSA